MKQQTSAAVGAVLLMVAWLTVNAIWGLTGPATLVSGWLMDIGALGVFVVGDSFVLSTFILVAAWRRDRKLLILALMLTAYVIGVAVSRLGQQALQPVNLFVNRSFILVPAIPMLIVARCLRSELTYPLKLGDWRVRCDLRVLVFPGWEIKHENAA